MVAVAGVSWIPETAFDQWATWLLHRRHGDDPDEIRFTLDRLTKVRDRVLDNARIGTGETVLDVGTGEGLIAFGAPDRVWERGTVILSDVSRDLLDHDHVLAKRMGVADRAGGARRRDVRGGGGVPLGGERLRPA